jgi:hypothetical protein
VMLCGPKTFYCGCDIHNPKLLARKHSYLTQTQGSTSIVISCLQAIPGTLLVSQMFKQAVAIFVHF